MVYTVTFNPAIDYVVHTGEMKLGSTNRSDREEMYFGGKGINVSIVLRELDLHCRLHRGSYREGISGNGNCYRFCSSQKR